MPRSVDHADVRCCEPTASALARVPPRAAGNLLTADLPRAPLPSTRSICKAPRHRCTSDGGAADRAREARRGGKICCAPSKASRRIAACPAPTTRWRTQSLSGVACDASVSGVVPVPSGRRLRYRDTADSDAYAGKCPEAAGHSELQTQRRRSACGVFRTIEARSPRRASAVSSLRMHVLVRWPPAASLNRTSPMNVRRRGCVPARTSRRRQRGASTAAGYVIAGGRPPAVVTDAVPHATHGCPCHAIERARQHVNTGRAAAAGHKVFAFRKRPHLHQDPPPGPV